MTNQANPAIVLANSNAIAPPAGHYSHVCIAGGFAYVSGMLPITKEGAPLANASFEEQAQQVLVNLQGCLERAGLTRDDLVQVRVYVTDIGKWPDFNRVYGNWIGSHRPARAVAGVSQLHFGLAVEVEAIALAHTAA